MGTTLEAAAAAMPPSTERRVADGLFAGVFPKALIISLPSVMISEPADSMLTRRRECGDGVSLAWPPATNRLAKSAKTLQTGLSGNMEGGVDPQSRAVWDIWREQLWSTFVRLESRSEDDRFFGRVERATEGSNRLACVRSTTQITERTAAHLRSDPQELILVAVQKTGHGYIEQDGRQARLEAGDFGLYDTTRPYRLYFDSPFQQLIVRFPRKALERRLPNLCKQTARRFLGQSGAGAVASGFALQLAENATCLGDEGLETFEVVAADLLATAIRYTDRDADYEDRARFERVQTRMMRHIRDENLDFDKIAAKEGMSLRTFQRLFQTNGSTPNRWLQDRRLEGAASEMRSSHLANRSITEIAFSWGFNDMSNFNRAFRARFGRSPSEWRVG